MHELVNGIQQVGQQLLIVLYFWLFRYFLFFPKLFSSKMSVSNPG